MNKKATKVVVVGGGFGGVKTALELAGHRGFEIQLISDNTHFEYHGALYRSAVGHSPMEVVIPLKDIFEGVKNVELVLDSAGFIDPRKKRLASLTGEVYSYDALVLGLGNTVNYFGIKGLSEHSEAMHDIASTIKLRNSLVELFTASSKPLRITIVGAGASGVELAGEIPSFSKLVAKKHGLKEPKLKLTLIDGAERVLPMFSPLASAKTARQLQKLGVDIHLNIKVDECSKGKLCTSAGDLKADLIIWTAGSKPVDFYANNPDIFSLGRGGRVVADEFLRPAHHTDMYVLGDNVDTPYSGMAQTALHDAKFIARNLINLREGRKMMSYKPRRPVYVVTAGPKWAVVEQGKSVRTGHRGWLMRRRADLAIFRNFEPYKQAVHTWRQANRMARF